MPRYVAFLRAVNVGGRVVKMDVLRKAFESLGFARVETFIASGNVIFETRSTSPAALEKRIEGALIEKLGYRVDTFIRSEAEVRDIAAYDPFRGRTLEGAATFVGLLAARPSTAARCAIDALETEEELFHTHERELYWHRKPSMRMATFSGAVLEKTIGGRATMRNINTLKRLAAKFAVPGRTLAIWLVLAGLLTSSPAADYAERADRGSFQAADYAERADTGSFQAADYAERADTGSFQAADYAERADTGSFQAADYAEHADPGSSPAAQSPPRIVDLGHPITATDPTWDGKPAFERSVVATFDKDGYTAGKIMVEEHFGTHLDAPAHFAKDGWTVDRIPVDRLYRPGVCINVTAQAAKDQDYRVTRADIAAFEAKRGAVPEGSVVLIGTGWDRFWDGRGRYMNDSGGVKHFPGLSVDAVTYLAKERRVAGIGIDTPSIDYGPSTAFDAHKVSMGLGVYHIENAAHLTSLPETGFMVVVAPIDIAGGSGGPTRLFAILR